MGYKGIKAKMALQVGQVREFMIVDGESAFKIEGGCLVSMRRIELQVAWKRCLMMAEGDVVVPAVVEQINPGGVTCVVEGLRGFLPASHLFTSIPKEELVGKELMVKFLEIDPEAARLVLSCKRAMLDSGVSMDSGASQNLSSEFKVGEVYTGKVQSVQVYGAFVDIGGMSGLLHTSQVSQERVESLENVFRVGDEIKVLVMSYDYERGRVQLSTRKLEPNPGDMLNNPSAVWENAEKMALEYQKQMDTAKNIVEGGESATEQVVEASEDVAAEVAVEELDDADAEYSAEDLGWDSITPMPNDDPKWVAFLEKYSEEAAAYEAKMASE